MAGPSRSAIVSCYPIKNFFAHDFDSQFDSRRVRTTAVSSVLTWTVDPTIPLGLDAGAGTIQWNLKFFGSEVLGVLSFFFRNHR